MDTKELNDARVDSEGSKQLKEEKDASRNKQIIPEEKMIETPSLRHSVPPLSAQGKISLKVIGQYHTVTGLSKPWIATFCQWNSNFRVSCTFLVSITRTRLALMV